MARYTVEAWRGKDLFVGIDMHLKQWHVTILNEDGLRLFSNRIAGTAEAIDKVLSRYGEAKEIFAVYEAGYFGFWLYDFLVEMGVSASVTPPSLIPSQSGNRVKTDPIDSFKLADYLRTGLLTSIYVPTHEERCHRQVSRRRRQFIKDRVRVQLRIKAELRYMGVYVPEESRGTWSDKFVTALGGVWTSGSRVRRKALRTCWNNTMICVNWWGARRKCCGSLRKQTRIGIGWRS